MNKSDLIQYLSEKVELNKKQAEDTLEALVDVITKTLQEGGEVTIAGFGAFMAKTRKARMGVNPQNPTEKMQIKEVRVPKFKAGTSLKKALKEPTSPTPSGL